MCTTVYLFDGEKCVAECDRVADLWIICPELVLDPSYKTKQADQCLCCIDVEATATKNGYVWFKHDYGDYELRRKA